MRKIKKPLKKSFPPVELYFDDLESICAILKQRVKSTNIIAEDYKMKSIKQLKKLGMKKTHHLLIECFEPYLRIKFFANSAEIYFAEDSAYNRVILSEIANIISKRKVLMGRFLTSFWAFALNGIITIGSFTGMIFTFSKDLVSSAWLCLGLLLLSIFSAILLCKLTFGWYSTIVIFERKREEDTFWKRNKDQLLIAIITATIAALFTAAVTLIINLVL